MANGSGSGDKKKPYKPSKKVRYHQIPETGYKPKKKSLRSKIADKIPQGIKDVNAKLVQQRRANAALGRALKDYDKYGPLGDERLENPTTRRAREIREKNAAKIAKKKRKK